MVCPYHGWAFDAEGKLRDVPSAEHGSWPKRPLVGAYDVEERGGFVWLFYGSKSMPADERPPIPMTPELKDPKWRAGEVDWRLLDQFYLLCGIPAATLMLAAEGCCQRMLHSY